MCAACYDPLRVVETLEGDATEERKLERKVRAKGVGEAMDVDETENDMASPPTSAPASTPTPDDTNKDAYTDSDVLGLPRRGCHRPSTLDKINYFDQSPEPPLHRSFAHPPHLRTRRREQGLCRPP
jgi:hypothetical protein